MTKIAKVMIENRNLMVGTRLVGRYKGQTCAAEVVQTEEGLRYRLGDGREFKSPSSAGSAVMGGHACNGWRFWGLEGEGPKATEPTPVADTRATGSSPRAARFIYRVPNQGGVAEGQTRFWCRGCMASFLADAGATPEACPEGHGAIEAIAL